MAIDWDRLIEVASGESLTVITISDEETVNVSAGKEILYIRNVDSGGGGGGDSVEWGDIGGVLNNQIDLRTALSAKANTADLGSLAFENSIDYSDVTNTPALGDLAFEDTVDYSDVTNTPTLGDLADHDTVDYATEVTNKPTLGNLASKDTVDYSTEVTNKPTLGSLASKNTADYATDVTNKPTLGTMAAIDDAPSNGNEYVRKNGAWAVSSGGGGTVNWGDIGGTLSDQTDLTSALEWKANNADLASYFESSASYTAGDCVIYNHRLYMFFQDKSAGAWDDNKAWQLPMANIMDRKLSDKQDTLTFDSTPTANSTNPVTSGGVKSYVDSHDDFLISGSVSSGGYTLTDARINSEHWEVDWVRFATPSNVLSDISWSTDITNHTVTLSATYSGATNVTVNMHYVQ